MKPLRSSSAAKSITEALLHEARKASNREPLPLIAPWLLCSVTSRVWFISKGPETSEKDGIILNAYEFDWSELLPDGSNLIDPINKDLLENLQLTAFYARQVSFGPQILSSFKLFLWTLKILTKWAFLQKKTLNPRRFGFTKLTEEDLTDFVSQLCVGGVAWALQYPQRFLNAVFPIVLKRPPTSEELRTPTQLVNTDCKKITEWLLETGGLKKSGGRNEARIQYLNASFIAGVISADTQTIRGGPPWQIFLSQFQLDDTRLSNLAQKPITGTKRQYPSNSDTTPTEKADSIVKQKTITRYLDDIRTMVSLHRYLPDFCPPPSAYNPNHLKKLINNMSAPSETTPWMPLEVSLTYANESIRWIILYGPSLVDVFLDTYKSLYEQGLLISAPGRNGNVHATDAELATAHKKLHKAREKFVSKVKIPSELIDLHITGWAWYQHLDSSLAFEKLQNRPSLLDAMATLVGAIALLISSFKSMRDSELRALKKGCISYKRYDGWWLAQKIAKRQVEDSRPIPTIVAKAIQLLDRLSSGIKNIIGVTDIWLNKYLFTFPTFGRYEAEINRVMTANDINAAIDTFCDYVNLQPDQLGRRWYYRTHIGRKTFLITFFWMWKYANLHAAAWMAGHSDVESIHTYITANFPGEELPALEAQYASQVLRSDPVSLGSSEITNIERLHREVCKQFGVRDVLWIDEKTLIDWLEIQFESKTFEFKPYVLKRKDDKASVKIAFKVNKREQVR